jgi:starvation-inducible DNA-binding protein
MATITSSLSEDARKVAGDALQNALVDLIDLSLLGKQAHWTVVGRNFRSLHLQLDEIVAQARAYADLVAERAAAIGYPPDGSARVISEGSLLPQLPAGWQEDRTVVEFFVGIYASLIEGMRERIAVTGDHDPVTQDLFLGITAGLEKQYWMFQAESLPKTTETTGTTAEGPSGGTTPEGII